MCIRQPTATWAAATGLLISGRSGSSEGHALVKRDGQKVIGHIIVVAGAGCVARRRSSTLGGHIYVDKSTNQGSWLDRVGATTQARARRRVAGVSRVQRLHVALHQTRG